MIVLQNACLCTNPLTLTNDGSTLIFRKYRFTDNYTILLQRLQDNWKSGLTVSLVSIPLSISLSVASGSTPVVGIITALWAGLIASLFAGSHFNIIGPTGALSGIIATYALLHGAESLAMLTLVTGVLIMIAYFFHLERYLIFIPSSVIHGFTLGVAFIIGLNQFNSAFGLHGLPQHERFFENVVESIRHIGSTSLATFGVFLLFLVCLFVFKRLVPKIPSPFLLAPIGILLGYLGHGHRIPLQLETLGDKFTDITFVFFQTPLLQLSPGLFKTAAAVALVAILETMLSAKIADGMTHTKHQERKEMFALGIANLVSGSVGGIPATAALARTALNIKSGATHKISATLNAIFIGGISFFLLGYFSYIPMAVIAAILVYVAIRMVEAEHFKKFYLHERTSFWVALAVAAITVYEDPMIGIAFGTALSLILFIEKISHGQFQLTQSRFGKENVETIYGDTVKEIKEDADVLLYSIRGKLAYINSRSHLARFESNFDKYTVIILRLREVYFIDLDGAEALDEMIEVAEKRGQKILLTSANPQIISMLEQVSHGYKKLQENGLVFSKTEKALESIGIHPTKE